MVVVPTVAEPWPFPATSAEAATLSCCGVLLSSLPDSEDAPDADVVVISVEELGKIMAWFGFTPRLTALTRCL